MRGTRILAALLAALATASRAAAQSPPPPAWDAQRHLLVVVSPLDSADVYPRVEQALGAEGLTVEHSDSARGRIICQPRASDSFGGQATVQYIALVHRVHEGGSEVWIGAMLRTMTSATDPSSFARITPGQASTARRMEGSFMFITPVGDSPEWRRLQRIGDAVAHAGP